MLKRLDWLDIGKGLGMVLVIFAHSDIPAALKVFIYTFHMPLFFFLSGYLFSPQKHANLGVFVRKKFSSLIVPYLAFSAVMYLWYVIKSNLLGEQPDLLKTFIGTFLAIRNSEWTPHTGPLWFIVCLFFTEVFFYLINQKFKTLKFVVSILLLSSVIGYFYAQYVGVSLVWNIDAALITVSFFGAGYFYKLHHGIFQRFEKLGWFFLLGVVNVGAGFLNYYLIDNRTDMFFNRYGNYLLFMISALAGIGAFIILIKMVKGFPVLQFIGRNSLIYLVLHQTIVFSMLDIFLLSSNSIPLLTRYKDFGSIGALYTIISLVAIAPVIYLIKNYAPFMLGQGFVRRKSEVGALNAER